MKCQETNQLKYDAQVLADLHVESIVLEIIVLSAPLLGPNSAMHMWKCLTASGPKTFKLQMKRLSTTKCR